MSAHIIVLPPSGGNGSMPPAPILPDAQPAAPAPREPGAQGADDNTAPAAPGEEAVGRGAAGRRAARVLGEPIRGDVGASGRETALLIPDTAAAAMAGISRAVWHRLRAAGKVPPPVRLGRSVRWGRAEIVAWIEASCPDARTWAAMQAAAGRRLKIG